MKRRSALKKSIASLSGMAIAGTASANLLSNENSKTSNSMNASVPNYSNKDFYDNGVLSGPKTLEAYKEMFKRFDYPADQFLLDNLFISDFGQGDFINAGMAGVFWHNSDTFGYFAHEIYLLPGQMIIEHKHVETKFPAKMETWHVRHGSIYCFGEEGETANLPSIPESQTDFVNVNKAIKVERGQMNTLNRPEAPHFMMAGPEGAIVSEYANFHDNDGLIFTNDKAIFNDCLS
ncbi:hypothetical protein [Aureibacter tunicatorum]|uniref:D-lyxose ketol-isomerase n=1 Tax=Aureibacter tunicatorum TaxID=866807 RepID=A0AAE3XSA1_9BACT|nr:hypothetical protein [Aureibacter tunicatorum]MDR6241610.1 D-lyxose ketol-isomerase [Aureibacter tunicatorum]